MPPVAILGVVGAVALVGVLAFVFLVPGGGPQATPGASEEAEARATPSASAAAASGEASGAIPSTGPSGGPSSEPSAPPQRSGLVVFSAELDEDADLWTWDPATDTVAPLLRASGNQRDPAWAPDGSAVVYRDGPGLQMITVDGDPYDPPDFTHHAQDRHPAWSPDGATVVFATDRRPFTSLDIATRPADDNEAKLTRLTDDPEDDWDPQWSPDSRQIVFVSLRDGRQHLWLMDADGGREREVDLGPGVFDDPMFSPDGEWLAFTRRERNTEKALYVARVDGSELRRLTNSGAREADLAWSPDGSTIAVVRYDEASLIVLVDVASGRDVGSFGVDGAVNRTPDWWWPPS